MIKMILAAASFLLIVTSLSAQSRSRSVVKTGKRKAATSQRQLAESRHVRPVSRAHRRGALSDASRARRVRLQQEHEAKLSRAVAAAAVNSPEDIRFEHQRGHLAWPCDSRDVSMHYGLQPYGGNLLYDNLGITIEVDAGTAVKSVFDGQVQSVMDVVDGVAVLVRHGKYISVYSNLSEADVAAGDSVTAGQVLGCVREDGPLEFRIYNTRDVYMDPEKWLMHEPR